MTIKNFRLWVQKLHHLRSQCTNGFKRNGNAGNSGKVTGLANIYPYNVMETPALVVGETVLATGKALKPAEVKNC